MDPLHKAIAAFDNAIDTDLPERLVVAPSRGVFRSLPPQQVTAEGEIVKEGQVIGVIDRQGDEVPVVSPHSGFFMGLLVLPGERVRDLQPLAWVRLF